MGIAWIVSEVIKHLLFSGLRSVWSWMKIKVNIINTRCISMSETVTMPSLMTMASTVSEESLAGDTHTYTHTQTDFGLVYLKLFQSHKGDCACEYECWGLVRGAMNKFKEDEELYIIITYSIYNIPCAPAFHNDGILSYICIIILCFASSFLFQKAPLFSCHGSFSKGSGNNFPRFTAHPFPFSLKVQKACP